MWADPLGRLFIILLAAAVIVSMAIGYGVAELTDAREITCWIQGAELKCKS